MAKLSKDYMIFYLLGREADVLDDDDSVDLDELADQMMDGTPVRELCDKVADSIAAPLAHDKQRKEWIEDNRKDIDEAGGDAGEAFRHYLQGRKDMYAYDLEADIVTAAFEEDAPEDDDDEDDEEDDDDEEES